MFLIAPGRNPAWPKRAACWSPAMPMIGMPAGSRPSRTVRPNSPDDGRTSGSMAAGTPKSSRRSSSQASRADVEEHGPRGVGRVGGVALPAGELPEDPGVRRAEGQAALVRPARGGRPGRGSTRPWSPRSRRRSGGPSSFRMRSLSPGSAASSRQRPAVRRHCQTMALATGRPDLPVPDDGRLALVGDADGGDRPARGPWPGPSGWCDRRSARSPRGRARPSRAGGSTGGIPRRPRRRPGRAGRRRWPGCRSCPGRWPGRGSRQTLGPVQSRMSRKTFSRPRSIESAWNISGYSMSVLSADRDLAEDLSAGPLVDEVVDAGDEEERRDREGRGQPPGPPLDRKERGQELQAGDAKLVGIRVHDRGVLGIAGGHLRGEGDGRS